MMIPVTFSELRNHAKKYFDQVEAGNTLEVYRNGKPVAILSPFTQRSTDRWKRARPLKLTGVSLSDAILAERAES